MTITTITPTALKLIAADVLAAIASVALLHDIDIDYDGGRYSNGATGEVKLKISARSQQAAEMKDASFKMNARYLGIAGDCLGKTFYVKGMQYRIAGFNMKAPKYPVNIERVHDGKSFKFRETTISKHYPAV
jgi:hypothetical protein